MFTVTFYTVVVVVCIVIAAIAGGISFSVDSKIVEAVSGFIAAGAVILIILSAIFGFVQADKNGKDNCTENLGGKVTKIGCIVGDDWKIIPNY